MCVVQLQQQQERVTESQEKVLNLKKDLGEMREWMAQVDEEFLMRDFEYKSPEELEEALQEMKVYTHTHTHAHQTQWHTQHTTTHSSVSEVLITQAWAI